MKLMIRCATIIALGLTWQALAVSPEEFAVKIEISVSETAQSEVVGEKTATDLPVLVRLSESAIGGFLYGDLRADGSDLAFGVDDGESITIYPHEIDAWDPSGESLVWVKIPTFSKDTAFTMYYGKGASVGAVGVAYPDALVTHCETVYSKAGVADPAACLDHCLIDPELTGRGACLPSES